MRKMFLGRRWLRGCVVGGEVRGVSFVRQLLLAVDATLQSVCLDVIRFRFP